jgi:hypothetical protein
MLKDKAGKVLFGIFIFLLCSNLFIFSFTDAYSFLKSGITPNRTMMQFAGIAVVVMAYGIWLKIRIEADTPTASTTLDNKVDSSQKNGD